MTIADLKIGEHAWVQSLTGRGAVRQRMLNLGILPGVLVHLERYAPAGDPLWIRVNNTQLSLRVKEAATVTLREESVAPPEAGPASAHCAKAGSRR